MILKELLKESNHETTEEVLLARRVYGNHIRKYVDLTPEQAQIINDALELDQEEELIAWADKKRAAGMRP